MYFYTTLKCLLTKSECQVIFLKKNEIIDVKKLLMSQLMCQNQRCIRYGHRQRQLVLHRLYTSLNTILIAFQLNRKKLTYPGESRVSMMPCSVSAHTTSRFQPEVEMK